jgi:hypothetical protein
MFARKTFATITASLSKITLELEGLIGQENEKIESSKESVVHANKQFNEIAREEELKQLESQREIDQAQAATNNLRALLAIN